MNRFSFNLENILQLRTFKEQQAELELQKHVEKKNFLLSQLEKIAHRKIQNATRPKAADATTAAQDFFASQMFLMRLEAEKEQILEKLTHIEIDIEKARTVYIAARREVQVIDKLKEKEFQKWHKAYLKEQDEAIDDIVTND